MKMANAMHEVAVSILLHFRRVASLAAAGLVCGVTWILLFQQFSTLVAEPQSDEHVDH